jgi:cysteine synthase A
MTQSHPLFRPHLIQGWTPDFIPKLTEDALDLALVDQIVPVDSGDAMRLSRELAQKEGIFVGTSGGAALAGALKVSESASEGSTVLCMLPDTGERYLSTPLFDGISVEMNEEELEISNSTPSARYEAAPPSARNAPAALEIPRQAEDFVRNVLADPKHPVVMFAFEWCEFSWSVRKLFAQCGIPFRSIDLDSVEFQEDNQGGKIRAAVTARTGSPTIPQVFVGEHFVGGTGEVFDAFKEGRLQKLLEEHHVAFDHTVRVDPHTLLPNWSKRHAG